LRSSKAVRKQLLLRLVPGHFGENCLTIWALMNPSVLATGNPSLKPDICSLDPNTMNSGAQGVIDTPRKVTRMAHIIRETGVEPELKVFTGDIHPRWTLSRMIKRTDRFDESRGMPPPLSLPHRNNTKFRISPLL
jgi:hypothetical protein